MILVESWAHLFYNTSSPHYILVDVGYTGLPPKCSTGQCQLSGTPFKTHLHLLEMCEFSLVDAAMSRA